MTLSLMQGAGRPDRANRPARDGAHAPAIRPRMTVIMHNTVRPEGESRRHVVANRSTRSGTARTATDPTPPRAS